MFPMEFPEGLGLIFLDVVVCDPESCDTTPEWTGELGKWVEEAVVDDLVEDLATKVRRAEQRTIGGTEQPHIT